MPRILILILLFTNIACSGKYLVPSLYPTSIEKTIKRFNYCMNFIHKMEIFQTLDYILTGPAKDDYKELMKFLYLTGIAKPANIQKKDSSGAQQTGGVSSGQTSPTASPSTSSTGSTQTSSDSELNQLAQSLKNELFDYARYAKKLRIKVLNVSIHDKTARVEAYFFDTTLIWEEKWIISLAYEDDLWKISEFKQIDPSNTERNK
ncbi:MAG: hypothetical protein OEZ36_12390 [Spirochaetota bacterium]|nr:hypothetical protein [Spirochaetota bacterium]